LLPCQNPAAELEPLFAGQDNANIMPAKPLNGGKEKFLLELTFGLSTWKYFRFIICIQEIAGRLPYTFLPSTYRQR
jgi:hypothetical protein